MNNLIVLSLRVTPELNMLVGDISTATKRNRTEVVRDAIAHYADAVLKRSDIQRRRQVTHEFLYLVADRLLSDSSPALYDDLIQEAQRRAEALYADS